MKELTLEQEQQLLKEVERYEKDLSHTMGGGLLDKVPHVLRQYRSIADNAIWKAKSFLEDTKVQFKALEIIVEGLTDQGLNHTQKRVIANHIIGMLRSMVDRLDQIEYKYDTSNFEHYNFYRSHTPERNLYEAYSNLKRDKEGQDEMLKWLKEQRPDVVKLFEERIPF